MKTFLLVLASSVLAIVAAQADAGQNKYQGRDMPNSHRVMAGGMSKKRPLDNDAKKIWEQAKATKSAKVPSNYLGTLGDPVYVQTQVVSGINYAFTFKNGMRVTVNNAPWRHPSITIVGVTHTNNRITTAAKPSDVAGMYLTQAQRARALQEFKKQDINHDGTITNGGAYTALMNLESKEEQSKHKCPGWEEITQSIVGNKPKKTIRIDDFMSKYTDFEVARRGMKYFSSFAGKDCVLTGKELQDGIQKTFGSDVTKDQTKQIIKRYSQDKDPNISFQEFYSMYKDYVNQNSDKPNKGKGPVSTKGTLTDKEAGLAEKGWNALDTSKDGFVENKEFSAKYQAIVAKMQKDGKSTQEVRQNLKEYFSYFAGKDGKLSHVEYLRMMEVMKSKVGASPFDKFLDALTSNNCGQLKDCYKCVAADLSCAWMPMQQRFGGGNVARKTDGRCVEQKTAKFFNSVLLRGAPANPGGSFTSQTQCGNKYDPRPHIFDGIMPHVTG